MDTSVHMYIKQWNSCSLYMYMYIDQVTGCTLSVHRTCTCIYIHMYMATQVYIYHNKIILLCSTHSCTICPTTTVYNACPSIQQLNGRCTLSCHSNNGLPLYCTLCCSHHSSPTLISNIVYSTVRIYNFRFVHVTIL